MSDTHRSSRASRVVLRILAMLAVAASEAAAQQPVLYQPDSSPPRRIAMAAAGVEVPLVDPGIPNTTLPVVEIMVNGRGPFRFGVETGAGFVAVSRAFVEAAGPLPRTGGPDEVPEYRVDSITLGGATFHDVRVSAMPRGATGVDGVLGLPFFRDVLLTIDYPARRLRLTRDTLPAANGRDVLQLSRAGPFWAVPIDLAGHAYAGVIDTRSTGTLGVTPEVGAALPFDGALEVVGRARGAGIPETEVKAGRLAGDVRIGAYTFPRPMLSVRPLPPLFVGPAAGPLVGDAVLQHFVVSLDQRRGRLRLAREGSPVIQLREPQRVQRPAGRVAPSP